MGIYNRGKVINSGYFIFNDIKVPFLKRNYFYKSINYLIDDIYLDDVNKLTEIIGLLYSDTFVESGDSNYYNSHIRRIYTTTNIDNTIEVSFETNLNIIEIRDLKLKTILINN